MKQLDSKYTFPTIDLLNSTNRIQTEDKTEVEELKERIIRILDNFNIEITSIEAKIYHNIIFYEITPQKYTSYSIVREYENDIALTIAEKGVRIISPIPGKLALGIEVPRVNQQPISIKEAFENSMFQEADMDLPIVIGETVSNEMCIKDLTKVPHILISGTSDAYISNCIEVIIMSLLYKKHPDELNLVIIDTTRTEFIKYASIGKLHFANSPYSNESIINDIPTAERVLNALCIEMDNRYKLLYENRSRSIKDYNQKVKNGILEKTELMPYIVTIIYDYSDLVMTAGEDVELVVCRLAQIARAVGIHVIVATDRTTPNIINDNLKANFPLRIAFQVPDKNRSIVILEQSGAEYLNNDGDILLFNNNSLTRVKCPTVIQQEIENVVSFISNQNYLFSPTSLAELIE